MHTRNANKCLKINPKNFLTVVIKIKKKAMYNIGVYKDWVIE